MTFNDYIQLFCKLNDKSQKWAVLTLWFLEVEKDI